MSTPAWILEIFAAIMLLVAEASAGQLVMARAWTRRGGTDGGAGVSHLLAGIAMAGILVPGLSILPNAAWEVVFAILTAWFGWRLWRESRGHGAVNVVRRAAEPAGWWLFRLEERRWIAGRIRTYGDAMSDHPEAPAMPVEAYEPPYYMAVFTTVRTQDQDGYSETNARMEDLVKDVPGFLGMDYAQTPGGLGITVGYFRDADALSQWRNNAEHRAAQKRGQAEWYQSYTLHVAKVERSHAFRRAQIPQSPTAG